MAFLTYQVSFSSSKKVPGKLTAVHTVNYDLGLYSVLDVRGNFTPPTQVVVVPTGTLNNTPYPVISYFNYTGSSSRVLIAYTGSSVLYALYNISTLIRSCAFIYFRLPPIRQVCSGILPFVIYSYTCSIISPFDFATLMGTSANSTTPCPPGTSFSSCLFVLG